MGKGIKNDITQNDGNPVVEVKTFADVQKLKEYKEKKMDVRIIMVPKNCIDPYPELVNKIIELLGQTAQIGLLNWKDEIKN